MNRIDNNILHTSTEHVCKKKVIPSMQLNRFSVGRFSKQISIKLRKSFMVTKTRSIEQFQSVFPFENFSVFVS